MKIDAELYWGLKNGEIDTELMENRHAFESTLKEMGRVTLATIKFPEKNIEFDVEFVGDSLELKKVVDP